MKKYFLQLLIICLCSLTYGQAQTKYLLVGRNLGTKTLSDSNSIRSFGFARNLSENPPIPGPTLYAIEGDSVLIDFWNVSQGASHTIHLHGLDVNQENDGVPHLSYTVEHMEHGYYRFKAPHPGVYLYHCHVISPIHVQAGMFGMVIVRPTDSLSTWTGGYTFHKEFAWMMHEIDTFWHQDTVLNQGHDHMIHRAIIPEYNPQFFMINGHSAGNELEADSISFKAGETALLRLANIGNLANRIKIPSGISAKIVSSDGRALPSAEISDTLWLMPGERYQVLLESGAEYSGTVQVEYINLNTQNVEHLSTVPIFVKGFLNVAPIQAESIVLYPNPSKQDIHLQGIEKSQIKSVEFFDYTGKNVTRNFSNNSDSLSYHSETKGLFILHIVMMNNRSMNIPFVLEH